MSSDDSAADLDLMADVGRAVWGAQWKRPLARALGVSHPTLLAVLVGRRPLSPEFRRRVGRWAGTAYIEERAAAQRRLAILETVRERWDPVVARE